MPFFTYDQNNSGGGFVRDDEAGIGERVIVEADTTEEANERAKRIGLCFDGEGGCYCCGYRWSMTYSNCDREDMPDLIYWGRTGPAFVHYADGRVEKHDTPTDESSTDAAHQYRDCDGDLWSRTPGGYYRHTEDRDGFPGTWGFVMDYDELQSDYGPLTPVTE